MRKIPQPTADQLAIREGDPVTVRLDDGSVKDSMARSNPWQLGHGTWVIMLDGKTGGYELTHCQPRQAAPIAAPAQQPSKVHTFRHVASDGKTTMTATVDLSNNDVVVTTNNIAKEHPELAAEALRWAESISTEIVPLLSRDQLRVAACKGVQAVQAAQERIDRAN